MVFPDISVCRWQGLVTTEYQAMIYVSYPRLRSEDISHLPKTICDFFLPNQNYSRVTEEESRRGLEYLILN